MSITAFLLPMAIAVCITAVETTGAIREKYQKCKDKGTDMEGIQTRFNDSALLIQTLEEHGSKTIVYSDNHIVVSCPEGELEYLRESADQPFMIYVKNVESLDRLLYDMDLLEEEYNMNVQACTYRKVLNNLEDNMRLEREIVLEDNSILLTISLDD